LELKNQLAVEAKERQVSALKKGQSPVPQKIEEREKGEAAEIATSPDITFSANSGTPDSCAFVACWILRWLVFNNSAA